MQELSAEFAAAVELVRRHRPATVYLKLACDRTGVVRLSLDRVEGLHASDLVRALDDGGIIETP